MQKLSISRAWEESKAIFARDGSLLVSVALALIALPSALSGLINPGRTSGAAAPLWLTGIGLVISLIALAGQLALIRLATGPSITVGGAIVHGLRRMPIYFVTALIIVLALMLVFLPFLFLAGGPAMSITPQLIYTAPVLLGMCVVIGVALFIGVRMIMAAPVASAEDVGPITIIKRSWQLTQGHWLRLLGFLLIFSVGVLILVIALGSAVGAAVGIAMGPIQPMSAGALIVALIQALISAAVTTVFAVMVARIYLQLAGRNAA